MCVPIRAWTAPNMCMFSEIGPGVINIITESRAVLCSCFDCDKEYFLSCTYPDVMV